MTLGLRSTGLKFQGTGFEYQVSGLKFQGSGFKFGGSGLRVWAEEYHGDNGARELPRAALRRNLAHKKTIPPRTLP
jgi:hypothetical protein